MQLGLHSYSNTLIFLIKFYMFFSRCSSCPFILTIFLLFVHFQDAEDVNKRLLIPHSSQRLKKCGGGHGLVEELHKKPFYLFLTNPILKQMNR